MQQLRTHRAQCAGARGGRGRLQGAAAGPRPRCAPARAVTAADTLPGLLAWAEANKIATDKLATAPSIATGDPLLVAARDVPAGEALLAVPDAAWVSPAAAARSPIGPKIAGLEPWLQLALLLLHERARGGGGGAGAGAVPGAYLSALPPAPDTPLFWDGDDVDALRGTQALQQLYGYRSFFKATFAELDAGLFASDRTAFPAEAFGYEAFLWAAATVRGRAHAPLDGASIALVPLADQVRARAGRGGVGKGRRRAGACGRRGARACASPRPPHDLLPPRPPPAARRPPPSCRTAAAPTALGASSRRACSGAARRLLSRRRGRSARARS
jgi:hypothetical protein